MQCAHSSPLVFAPHPYSTVRTRVLSVPVRAFRTEGRTRIAGSEERPTREAVRLLPSGSGDVLLLEWSASPMVNPVHDHTSFRVTHRVNHPVGVIDERPVREPQLLGLRNDRKAVRGFGKSLDRSIQAVQPTSCSDGGLLLIANIRRVLLGIPPRRQGDLDAIRPDRSGSRRTPRRDLAPDRS